MFLYFCENSLGLNDQFFDEANETVGKNLLIYTRAVYSHVRVYAFCIFQEMNFACGNAVPFWKVQSKFLRPCMGEGRKSVGKK